MRLKFYILWFENEPTWVDEKAKDVKEIIEDNGFEWVEPTVCEKEGEFQGNYKGFDMILVDYRLVDGGKDGQTGADIIGKIREDCFSNILFYSQSGEVALRKEITNKNLDGVFCADRSDFLDRFEKVFLAYIKKIEDVNNLRGLVMAETADLESLSAEIIELYDRVKCPKKKEYIKKDIKEMLAMANKQKTFFESKDNNTTFKELLEWLDFYRKSIIIDRINKRGMPVSGFTQSTFNEEIIVKRNLLAHVIESKKDGKIVLESKNQNRSLIFSQEEARQIRKDILRYKSEFDEIKQQLLQEVKE